MKIFYSTIKIFRYGIIGVSINLTGYSLYLLMTTIGFSPKIVMSVLYVTGVGIGFFAHRQWTFRHKGHNFNTGMRYLIAQVLGYLLNLSILVVMVDNFGYLHQCIQAISIFIVSIFLFFMFKLFVFRPIECSNLEYE